MPLLADNPKGRLILGTMTFGPDKEAGARVTDLADYNKCLDYLQSQGYNEIDTARAYIGGKQEGWTKDANWNERGLTLATKHYPFQPGEHKPEKIRAALETSLKELGEKPDIYYLHAADRSVPFEETLAEVDKMHKEGKFVRLGLSNFTAFEVAEVVILCRAHGWVRPSIYQGMYNCLTRSLDAELIPACRRYGLDIVVYNPLVGGLMSGKYKLDEVPTEGRFSDTAKSGAMYRARYFKQATFDALKMIQPVVEENNLTLLETAIRWCVHHSQLKIKDGNDGIIIGVSSLSQLESNIKDFEKGPLPEAVVKVLDDAWLVTKATTPNYWHLDLKYTYDTQAALFGNSKPTA